MNERNILPGPVEVDAAEAQSDARYLPLNEIAPTQRWRSPPFWACSALGTVLAGGAFGLLLATGHPLGFLMGICLAAAACVFVFPTVAVLVWAFDGVCRWRPWLAD